jgi:hypothetical protein
LLLGELLLQSNHIGDGRYAVFSATQERVDLVSLGVLIHGHEQALKQSPIGDTLAAACQLFAQQTRTGLCEHKGPTSGVQSKDVPVKKVEVGQLRLIGFLPRFEVPECQERGRLRAEIVIALEVRNQATPNR